MVIGWCTFCHQNATWHKNASCSIIQFIATSSTSETGESKKSTLRISMTLPNKTGIQEKIQKPFYRVITWMVIIRDFPYDVWIGVIFHDPCASPEQRFIKDSFPEISADRPVDKDDIWCWFHSSIFHFHPLTKMIPTFWRTYFSSGLIQSPTR